MQKIDFFVLKGTIDRIKKVVSADFDTHFVYRSCIWTSQLSGESTLFTGLVRVCNFVD